MLAWLIFNRWLPWNDLGASLHAPGAETSGSPGLANLATPVFALRCLFLSEPITGFQWESPAVLMVVMMIVALAILVIAGQLHWPGKASASLIGDCTYMEPLRNTAADRRQ